MKMKSRNTVEYYYKLDDFANQEGGATKLTILLQKRARELIKGLPPLIDIDTDDPVQIVLEELLQGKITLEKPDDIAQLKDRETKKTKG